MKIKGHDITIIENHANEPWPRAICYDGKRMNYNDRWENTARGQIIYYKDHEDTTIFQGVGILHKDLLRVIESEEKEMKYTVKSEYIDQWYGNASIEEIEEAQANGFTEEDISRMANDWSVSVEELMEQVEEA